MDPKFPPYVCEQITKKILVQFRPYIKKSMIELSTHYLFSCSTSQDSVPNIDMDMVLVIAVDPGVATVVVVLEK